MTGKIKNREYLGDRVGIKLDTPVNSLPQREVATVGRFNAAVYTLALISTALSGCAVSGGPAPILLFNGTGASRNDVAAVEIILKRNHLNYSTVSSSRL